MKEGGGPTERVAKTQIRESRTRPLKQGRSVWWKRGDEREVCILKHLANLDKEPSVPRAMRSP